MTKEEAQDLLARYAHDQCTPEERILVERWYLKESGKPDTAAFEGNPDFSQEEMWRGTLEKAGLSPERSRTRFYVKIASAAAVLLFIGFGAFFFSQQKQRVSQVPATVADPLPGHNRAVLTLGNGTRIILDDNVEGTLARQGDVTIKKTADGQIVYDASASNNEQAESGFNTISTPRGGEYRVILPDGSKVWLNSASSINFPAKFAASQRSVTLTGEAYFEIAKDPERPFNVSAKGTKVSVLGTHFNLMAYDDEASVKATLLEGSIRVSSGASFALIKAGEQANISAKDLLVRQVDIEEVVAWTKGYFYFKNTDIRSFMRQLSRWYDVDVEYRGEIPKTVFTGKMYRNVKASKMLDILSYFQVNFRVESPSLPSQKMKIVIL